MRLLASFLVNGSLPARKLGSRQASIRANLWGLLTLLRPSFRLDLTTWSACWASKLTLGNSTGLPRAAIEQLCRIKGVGRWTAAYFLLRGLGRTHIFPGDDVGARNHLQRWLGLPGRLDYDGVRRALAGWEGFGGLIYFHLLLKSLVEKGTIFD